MEPLIKLHMEPEGKIGLLSPENLLFSSEIFEKFNMVHLKNQTLENRNCLKKHLNKPS